MNLILYLFIKSTSIFQLTQNYVTHEVKTPKNYSVQFYSDYPLVKVSRVVRTHLHEMLHHVFGALCFTSTRFATNQNNLVRLFLTHPEVRLRRHAENMRR